MPKTFHEQKMFIDDQLAQVVYTHPAASLETRVRWLLGMAAVWIHEDKALTIEEAVECLRNEFEDLKLQDENPSQKLRLVSAT